MFPIRCVLPVLTVLACSVLTRADPLPGTKNRLAIWS